jgi:hypothetical protein
LPDEHSVLELQVEPLDFFVEQVPLPELLLQYCELVQQLVDPQVVYPDAQTQEPLVLHTRLAPEQLPEQQRPPRQSPEEHWVPLVHEAPLPSLLEQVPLPELLLQY